MTAPIKTCNYCGAVGVMPTFMNGETVCYDCLPTLPKTLPEAWREIAALRAKIEAMEKQEPVAFALYSGWSRKAVYLSEIEACEQRDRRQLTADLGGSLEAYRVGPLYALPGAKGEEK